MRFIFIFLFASALGARALTSGEVEFFEKRIRPVLVEECQECHGAEKQKGGLRLDSREGWQKGGDSGVVLKTGDAQSLLLRSIRHEEADNEMPKKRPKLAAAVIADFERWVQMGAPDPRDKPSATGARPWAAVFNERKAWWSLQPVRAGEPPAVQNAGWSSDPVDRFLLAKMEAAHLAPAADADAATLCRRLTFVLTGLPPTPEEVGAFAQACERGDRKTEIAKLSARLLASPRFGEHWGRHWLDLVRFAETHGSEGDPVIPEAWRYRDYVIRAFNADVPADQLIREHLAGDLLAAPRWSADGQDESMLGTAHLRLVEHGYQPVDTLDEQVKTVDSQLDVAMKAFQGLTVTCARCHDHKFDAISQRDYTALYGVFASCRPAMLTLDRPELLAKNRDALAALKTQIKAALATAWLVEAERVPRFLLEEKDRPEPWKTALRDAEKAPANPLHPWVRPGEKPAASSPSRTPWEPAGASYAQWFRHGAGLGAQAVSAGDFTVQPEGDRVVVELVPAGAFTAAISTRQNGLLTSPRFRIESDFISVRVSGSGGAWVRLIVDHYPLGSNSTYPRAELKSDETGWVRFDTRYRRGSMAYLECATANDLSRFEKKSDRSWFSLSSVRFHDDAATPAEPPFSMTAAAPAALAEQYRTALIESIRAWQADSLTEPQRVLLDFFVHRGLLPTTLDRVEAARPLVAEYRRLESEVPVPRRAPGVLEAIGVDAPFLPRGDHLKPGEPVPRAWLSALGGQPFATAQSGRLQLAEAITDSHNPLTARVLVNRVWQHVFGRGLVGTPDNFGKMGELPTHPELLDFLAARFVAEGWSLKKLIAELVNTRAFALSSEPSSQAAERDAANALLSHARVRRLDAESIRDSLLLLSGQLTGEASGPSADIADHSRRSIFLVVRRNALSPFLAVFDAPRPFSTLGRRDVTNVPAQSLTLLNDPFVLTCAERWAARFPTGNADERIRQLFFTVFGRSPADAELSDLTVALAASSAKNFYRDAAHTLINTKEFLYLR